jgi:hypothetical protein
MMPIMSATTPIIIDIRLGSMNMFFNMFQNEIVYPVDYHEKKQVF